ncbi:hypothetical protein BV898_14026 [Hypsibius exemplaris]|uniref:Uncharacterized protein n=1 Tax=Hypsibius exemplaris TaxID=2072580 RepID=A0A1W0W954_HYPEX|nr:hypothetical protein BV898_14026 [Hypsibius exemplaris]
MWMNHIRSLISPKLLILGQFNHPKSLRMRVGLLRLLAAEATAVLPKKSHESSGKLAKPVLKGWLAAETRRHAIYSFALSIGLCFAYRELVGEPRKRKYEAFWRTYDEHADFKRMVKAGLYTDITIEDFEAEEQAQLKELKKAAGRK